MRLLITAALLIGAAQTVFAAPADVQKTPVEGSYSLAPQFGITSFTIGGSGMSSRSGMVVGAEFYIPLPFENMRFETGLNFMEMGAKNDYWLASTEYEISALTVPLLAQWTFSRNEESGRQWSLRGGAILTQTMGAKLKDSSIFGGTETDVKGDVAANDVLLTAGLGWSTKVFDDYRVTIDGSYSQGTVNTIKSNTGKSSGYALATSLVIPL